MRLRYGPESSADSEPVPAFLDHEHVVGVDDGGTDDSREIMTSAGARVVRHAVNPRAGTTFRTGLTFSLLDSRALKYLEVMGR